jgi:hypothetical protein
MTCRLWYFPYAESIHNYTRTALLLCERCSTRSSIWSHLCEKSPLFLERSKSKNVSRHQRPILRRTVDLENNSIYGDIPTERRVSRQMPLPKTHCRTGDHVPPLAPTSFLSRKHVGLVHPWAALLQRWQQEAMERHILKVYAISATCK